jgi:predicted nuclease with RNAse H fold
MIGLLGIDCATKPQKTGLALGELRGEVVHVLRCATGTRCDTPAIIAANWLADYDDALIALDAPLGWPQKMGVYLSAHRAGLPIQAESNQLFRRATDVEIKERLKKQPLEVGANLIARTAVAALELLDQIRHFTERPIPLAWAPTETERWRAIEVYPAATRIAHGAPDVGGSLEGLDELLDCSAVLPALTQSKDAVDAAVCTLAAADFIRGRAIKPQDHETALVEGWIWAPMPC